MSESQPLLSGLYSTCYDDLRRFAHARFKKPGSVTLLDSTELVHESYLRFVRTGQIRIEDRAHFFAYAARVMRSVIVDIARQRAAKRNGGGNDKPLDPEAGGDRPPADIEIVKIHDALDDLAAISERLARVVEMRYFAGMTEVEIAEALGITERTVRRDWEKARVLLAAALKDR
jgi:RNA polymerase sigma factor (TIGR02999 family)